MDIGLDADLRQYIIKNNLAFYIDFDRLLVDKKSSFHILVLRKPKHELTEIVQKAWMFTSKYARLLIYDRNLKTTIIFPLKFSFSFPDSKIKERFNFCDFSFLKTQKNKILIAKNGLLEDKHCLQIAIFDITGRILSAWKLEGKSYGKNKIKSFREEKKFWLITIKTQGDNGFPGELIWRLDKISITGDLLTSEN